MLPYKYIVKLQDEPQCILYYVHNIVLHIWSKYERCIIISSKVMKDLPWLVIQSKYAQINSALEVYIIYIFGAERVK